MRRGLSPKSTMPSAVLNRITPILSKGKTLLDARPLLESVDTRKYRLA
ncbi:MAG: hypothetical protein IPK70_12030 [Flavobacteriales bacterium]|nr:hypothetical protein [Flavobacteriales bacterium]